MIKSNFFKVIIIFTMMATLNSFMLADDDNEVKGFVFDKSSNKPLIGAKVQVMNSKKGDITDNKGKFKIEDIKEQEITVITSYTGYDNDTTKVIFTQKDDEKEIEIFLTLRTFQGKSVIVEGSASGQTKAFIDQSRAVNIKNIVSSEQIASFPDLNAADAMQRIPGITLQRDQGEGRYVQLRGTPPEFTNFNINGEQIPSPEGDVRYVGMDIIAADQIESIEITKVLTPDLDADGIGGNVNIITKTAKDSIPEINATIAGGYNNLRQTNNYQIQFSYGQRLNKFGFSMNGSYFLNDYGSDNIEYKYAKGPLWGSTGDAKDNYYIQYREVQLRHYTLSRERIGLSSTLDYKFNDNHSIYLRGMFNSFGDDETRRRKIYDLEDALSENYYINGRIKHEVRHRTQEQLINALNLGGKSDFEWLQLEYEVDYSVATENIPNFIQGMFGTTGQYTSMKFDKDDENFVYINYPDSNNSKNIYAYDTYELDDLLMESSTIRDENITGKIDFSIPYKINNSNSGLIKLGGKVRIKEKMRDVTAQDFGAYFTTSKVYPGTGPELNLNTISDDFVDDNLLEKSYLLDYMPSADNLRYFFEMNSQFFIYDRTKTKMESFGRDYNANEDIYAGYAMFQHNFNSLMVLGGVRFEQTNIDYQGMKIITERGNYKSMDSLYDKRTKEFLLPQLQLKYTYNDNLNFRFGFTKSYSRPNFEDVLPYREQDREEVKYGNPNLNYPMSWNFDFLSDFYPNNSSVFSGGFFYKQIDNFVFYYKRFAHEGTDFSNYGIVEIEKAVNGDKANVYGAEIQMQFKFDIFTNSFFKNFGIFTNYTYTKSEAFIAKRKPANYADAVVIFGQDDVNFYDSDTEQETIQLPGQAENTGNFAIFYDDGVWYAKLSANYHDDFLYKLGADPDLDEYYNNAFHLDFTASYSITNKIKVFTDFINLTNEPLRYYSGSKDYIAQQEFYSWWGRVGFKLSM